LGTEPGRSRYTRGGRACRQSTPCVIGRTDHPFFSVLAVVGGAIVAAAVAFWAFDSGPAPRVPPERLGWIDRREDPHRPATAPTHEDVDREDPLHQLCQREPPHPGGFGLGRCVVASDRNGRPARDIARPPAGGDAPG
jgi:hypothetical protein